MDKHDEQFEAFLRRFQLRQPMPVPEMESFTQRSSVRRVLAAAAALVLVVALSMMIVRNSNRGHGPQATVEVAGNPSVYSAGQVIEAGVAIRSNSAQGLTLALEDGSHVELHEQSELVLESAADGIRVRLNGGSILVTAAKQGAGHLYVQTKDAVVSVVGTVFFVSTEQSGTRVGVVEGEVLVQQGAELKKLNPGEQVATSSSIQLKSVAEEISWSRNAAEYVAKLQQPGGEVGLPNSSPALAGQAGDAPELKYKELSVLPIKVQAYYVGNGNAVRTLITVQILTRDLAFQDLNGAQTAEAGIEGVISRPDNQRVALITHSLLVQFPSLKAKNELLDKPNLFQETQYLAPGKYRLQLTVKDKNSQNVGITDTLLSVPRLSADTLQASSMILADSLTDLRPRSVGTEMFDLGDKRVVPNITGVFRTDQNLNIWQEIYGLTVGPAARSGATFELVISQNKQEIKKLATYPPTPLGSGQKMTYSNSVPLEYFVPGEYDVQIKVTDSISKVSLVSTSRFSVIASPAAQSDLSLLSRTCGGCHSVEAALNLGARVSPFTASDRGALSSKQAELVRLLAKGDTRNHPDVMKVQSEIDALQRREAAALNDYSTFVLRHLTELGGSISGPEFPMLTRYLFEAVGKNTEPPASSVSPLQQPPSPEVQGKSIFDRACTTCHNAAAAGSANYPTRNAYESLVAGERNKGAMISDAEVPLLVDYLFNTFGKKSAPTGDVPVQPAPPRGR